MGRGDAGYQVMVSGVGAVVWVVVGSSREWVN